MSAPDVVSRVMRGLSKERLWAVVLLDSPLDDILDGAPPRGRYLTAPERDRYWADPFPYRSAAGDLWVFVEEFQRWRGLGSIVALRLSDDYRILDRCTVLRSRHHFSFPQVHSWDGTPVATVESCDPTAPTYTFTGVGEPWIASLRTLPMGVIDPALAIPPPGTAPAAVTRTQPPTPWAGDEDDEDEDLRSGMEPPPGADWYLTGTSGSDEFAGYRQWSAADGVGWEEAESLRFRDDVLARPAGNADLIRGIRSAQDCSDNYGIATSVVTWDPVARGPGSVLRRLTAEDFGHGALGTHTLAWTADGSNVVADVWKRGTQPMSALHRAIEQLHPSTCRGRRAAKRLP